MAVDENGVDPKARDGVPDADQLEADQVAMRRARRAAESDAEAEAAMGARRGQPIDEQPSEDEAEMFPMGSIPGDHRVTLKNIVPAAKGRSTEAKMGSAAIPMREGLVRYGELLRLVVTVEAGKVLEQPDLQEPDAGGNRLLMGVKDVQHFRPVHVESAADLLTVEQVVDILEKRFGIPRSSDKIAEVFGPQTAEQRAAVAAR